MSQYDLFKGREERDKGIAQVDSNDPDWAETALQYIIDVVPHGMELDNQAIQHVILRRGCPAPKNPNSWGSLFQKAKRAKVLVQIGYTQARRVASHARIITIYRRT